MKILYIPLDFQEWSKARHLTYFFSLGFEEAFRANGIEFVTIPTLCKDSAGVGQADDQDAWLAKARILCDGIRFDQAWVEAVHNPLSDGFLRWLESVAPIRLAMVGESLVYDQAVGAEAPHLARRKALVENRLRHFTHALIVDEKDAADLSARSVIKTFWYPSAVPERFLGADPLPEPDPRASFSGAVYGKRGSLLEDPRFQGLLSNRPSQDAEAGITRGFDDLQRGFLGLVHSGKPIGWDHLSAYLRPLRLIRSESFRLWIRMLSRSAAVVNLPSFYQGYAGRVAEGICAGRPVISWDVQGRPRNRALFKVGEEILLFHEEDREGLLEHIRQVIGDPLYAQRVAGRALRRMWRFHTLEKRVGQILAWMRTGEEPDFSENETQSGIPEAMEAFEDCLADRKPDEVRAQMARGSAFEAAGDFQSAALAYLNAIKGGRNDVETWLACARAGMGAGNEAIARIALEGAQKLQPHHPGARALESALRNRSGS